MWSRLLLLAVSLGVVLGISECALRAWSPLYLVGIQDAYQYDEELGYRYAPGIHRYKLTDHLEEIRTNEIGSFHFQEHFDGYGALVFALGDSYTEGVGVSADASYPFQLDLLLNLDADGRYVERYGVVNLGLAAYGTEQSFRAAKRWAGLLRPPKFVLYFGCDNDWDDDVLFRSGYRHQHFVKGSPVWEPFVGTLLWLGEFELVKRAKYAVSEVRHSRRVQKHTPRAEGPGPSVAERVWPALEQIVELSREWDATLVLGWANPRSDSYAWLKAKAAAEGIPFADWAPAMESVRAEMPDLNYANPHSGGHWRPWTNGVIARSYARSMGVWEPARVRDPVQSAR